MFSEWYRHLFILYYYTWTFLLRFFHWLFAFMHSVGTIFFFGWWLSLLRLLSLSSSSWSSTLWSLCCDDDGRCLNCVRRCLAVVHQTSSSWLTWYIVHNMHVKVNIYFILFLSCLFCYYLSFSFFSIFGY